MKLRLRWIEKTICFRGGWQVKWYLWDSHRMSITGKRHGIVIGKSNSNSTHRKPLNCQWLRNNVSLCLFVCLVFITIRCIVPNGVALRDLGVGCLHDLILLPATLSIQPASREREYSKTNLFLTLFGQKWLPHLKLMGKTYYRALPTYGGGRKCSPYWIATFLW